MYLLIMYKTCRLNVNIVMARPLVSLCPDVNYSRQHHGILILLLYYNLYILYLCPTGNGYRTVANRISTV